MDTTPINVSGISDLVHSIQVYPQLAHALGQYTQFIDSERLQIFQTVSGKSQIDDSQYNRIIQTPSEQSDGHRQNPLEVLLGKLSFSHFIELIKIDAPLKRLFYETEAIVNNWSVRELQRAIDSMLFERKTDHLREYTLAHRPRLLSSAAAHTITIFV